MAGAPVSWLPIAAVVVGCYALKLAGTLLPERLVRDQRVALMATLIPVALIASLIALQTITVGHGFRIDARLAGVGVAAVAVICRAPFIVVVLGAALTAAVIRAL